MAANFNKNMLQRLGRNLRDSETPASEDIALLQEYRLYHKDLVKKVFDIVCEQVYNINQEAICAFRIKRIDSIIRKLQRLKGKLELKSMKDIAGCRCILKSDTEVFKLMNNLKNTPLKLVQDPNIYMGKRKKDNGYGSIHMYVTLADFDKLSVEIQIRTEEQHDWATFVETMDLLYNMKFKENTIGDTPQEQYEDFCRLHKILSKKEEFLTDEEEKSLLQLVVKYDIMGKLDTIFVQNLSKVRKLWADILSNTRNPRYFYIGTNNNMPSISAYTSYEDAEKFYYNAFEECSNKNQVIVSVTNPSYKTISMAYSNYMLVCHKFAHRIHALFAKIINKVEYKYSKLITEYTVYYNKTAFQILDRIDIEWEEMENLKSQYGQEIILEWVIDIKRTIQDYKSDFRNIGYAAAKSVFVGTARGFIRWIKIGWYYFITSFSPNYFLNRAKQLTKQNETG